MKLIYKVYRIFCVNIIYANRVNYLTDCAYQFIFGWHLVLVSKVGLAYIINDSSFSLETENKRSSIPNVSSSTIDQKHTGFRDLSGKVSQVRLYNSFVRCTLGNRRRICFKGIVFNTSLVSFTAFLFTFYRVCLLLLLLAVCSLIFCYLHSVIY